MFLSFSGFSVTVTPAQSNVAPGDSVFLRCSHTSTDRGASYAWERLDGMDMMATGRFEASGRSGEVLRITFAEEADSGVYVCRVTSSQGVQTSTAEIFVGEFQLSSSFSLKWPNILEVALVGFSSAFFTFKGLFHVTQCICSIFWYLCVSLVPRH